MNLLRHLLWFVVLFIGVATVEVDTMREFAGVGILLACWLLRGVWLAERMDQAYDTGFDDGAQYGRSMAGMLGTQIGATAGREYGGHQPEGVDIGRHSVNRLPGPGGAQGRVTLVDESGEGIGHG